MSGPAVVRLQTAGLGQATGVLAAALGEDPLVDWLLPDRARRDRLLPQLCRYALRYAIRHGEVYTTASGAQGVAAWLPPAKARPTIVALVRAGASSQPFALGPRGGLRVLRLIGYRCRLRPLNQGPAPRWHLWALGVAPASRGQGLGGALLRPMLTRADAEVAACSLQTCAETNVRFYQGHGFAVVHEGRLPGNGPPVWAMRRPPRSQASSTATIGAHVPR